MNDLLNGTLDGMTPDDASLDLGSFDGFDPFAEEEPSSEAPAPETAETTEPTEPENANVTSLPERAETPLSSEPSTVPTPSAPTPASQQKKASATAAKPAANPLQQAIEEAEVEDVKETAAPVFSRPPVFSHGGVNEDITDPKMTFDQLREEKSRDFSELEDAGKVSWTVEYGTAI